MRGFAYLLLSALALAIANASYIAIVEHPSNVCIGTCGTGKQTISYRCYQFAGSPPADGSIPNSYNGKWLKNAAPCSAAVNRARFSNFDSANLLPVSFKRGCQLKPCVLEGQPGFGLSGEVPSDTLIGFPGRGQGNSFAINGTNFVSAGITTSTPTYLNDVWASPDNGLSWTRVTDKAAFSPRAGANVAVVNGRAIMAGGNALQVNVGFVPFNDVWATLDGFEWTLVCDNCPTRGQAGTIVIEENGQEAVLLVGGYDYFGATGLVTNTILRSDDSGASWSVFATAPFPPRANMGLISPKDGTLVMMGGGDDNAGTFFNDIWQSRDNGRTWVQLTAAAAFSPREGMFVGKMIDPKAVDVVVLAAGSSSTAALNDVFISCNGGQSFSPVRVPSGLPLMYQMQSIVHSAGYTLIGGFANNGEPLSSVYVSSTPRPTPGPQCSPVTP